MMRREYILPADMLRDFAGRCAGYDRENRFFHEDFEDLRRAGYLTAPAPQELGGAGMFRGNELERLFRDARCGRFHPANSALVHEIVGKTALGIDLGEQPRCG